MMFQRTKVAVLVLGLGAWTGCDKLAEAVADKAAAAAVDAQEAGMTEDDKLGNKLAGYIGCINNTSRSVTDAKDRYFDWVDEKAGITGKETSVYGVYEVSDPSTCVTGIKTAADAEPEDAELEGAAAEYLAALEAAMPVINEAHKYYEDENYNIYCLPPTTPVTAVNAPPPLAENIAPRAALLPPMRSTGSEITGYLQRPE